MVSIMRRGLTPAATQQPGPAHVCPQPATRHRHDEITRHLSRRDLLKVGAGAGAVLFFGADRAYTQEQQQPSVLTRNVAAALSRTLYQAAEAIAPYQPDLSTLQQVQAFEQEYVPHLAADGVVKDDKLQFPPISSLDYLKSEGSVGVFHILGETACHDPHTPITLNDRFFTPYSPWRERNDTGLIIATAAHELAHANQVSCTPFDPLTETATQMVSMNTLAGMAMEGNTLALPGFLSQMGEFADDYVLAACLREEDRLIQARTPATPTPTPDAYSSAVAGGQAEDLPMPTYAPKPDPARFTRGQGLGWYAGYLGTLPNGTLHQANWARSLDYWLQTDWRQLDDIITKYGSVPYIDTMQAMQDKSFLSPPLPIGPDQAIAAPYVPLRMFSTHYVLQNLQPLVAAYQHGNR